MDKDDSASGNTLTFWLNGEQVTLHDVDPTLLLADYLRGSRRTGTKIGCGEGGCGSCTVMLSRYDRTAARLEHLAVNACLRPLCSVAGMAVTTIEGIGNLRDGVDPVQFRIAANNGSQCGFCTPGFVMNMYTLLQNNAGPTQQEIENLFDGNLCRCTGYRAILHGMRTFAADAQAPQDASPGCQIDPAYQPAIATPPKKMDFSAVTAATAAATEAAPAGTAPALEPFAERGQCRWFRPERLEQVYQCITSFYANKTAIQQLDIHAVMLVVGHTSIGVCNNPPKVFIDISELSELTGIATIGEEGIRFGASVSIQRLIDYLGNEIKTLPADETSGFAALCDLAGQIGSLQIRNVGSVGGNIFLAKSFEHYYESVSQGWHPPVDDTFVSDLVTALATLDATATLYHVPLDPSQQGFTEEKIPILGLPPLVGDPNEYFPVFLEFFIPRGKPKEIARTYKIAHRAQNGQALVNAGFRVRLDDDRKVADIRIVFGGLGTNSAAAADTEKSLLGKPWNEETLSTALAGTLAAELGKLTVDWPGSSDSAYRIALAAGLFYRFFLDVALELDPGLVRQINQSGAKPLDRPLSSGQQSYPVYPADDPVGRPMIKRDAFLQATGEAEYTHDLPMPAGGLHSMIVASAKAAAWFDFKLSKKEDKIVDLPVLRDSLRGKFEGFVDFITYADVPGNAGIGAAYDDPVFVPYKPGGSSDEMEENLGASYNTVTCAGAQIGLVVAETAAVAKAVARYVEAECITYMDVLEYFYEGQKVPVVIPLQDAIEKDNQFSQSPKTFPAMTHIPGISRQEPEKDGNEAPPTVSASVSTGAQAQLYLETQAALAVPAENDQLTLYASTQNPAGDQAAVAWVMGWPVHRVSVVVRRIGGGFGGKQTRSAFVSSAVAVAAWKLNRPVKLVLPRKTDMVMVGKRHPFQGDYAITSTPDGVIKSWKTVFRSDGGNTYDMSFPVMDLAQLSGDNVYDVEDYRSEGKIYRTNKASNTAMRSFGVIQTILIQETAIEHLACKLSQDRSQRVLPEEIRRRNLYRTGTPESFAETPFGQELRDCDIQEIWDDLWQSAEFARRDQEIQEFNRRNRWKKRGISMIPLKYGVSYTGPRGTLNQGHALVNVYSANIDKANPQPRDGSVLVLCGGIEMGQGLSTKIAQIAARTLGIPLRLIKVGSMNTDAVPNSTPTAASTGSDLNGGAVELACQKLRSRLEGFCRDFDQYQPYNAIKNWETDWQRKWPEIVARAYVNRVNLSAQAHYKTPHYSDVNINRPKGHPFFYFTYSAAVSEVEIDVLTGQFTILRSDILYDTGRSLNPCIDVGQIEGAFVQGVGYVTSEEIRHDASGNLITNRLWNYKPPFSKDIPVDFRVRLVRSREPVVGAKPASTAVMSSKGIGEPPLVLATSVFFAIRHAIMDARQDQGLEGWFAMDSPATVQRIKESCGVKIENMCL
jgi:xanthine dehydrogenase/oxidase